MSAYQYRNNVLFVESIPLTKIADEFSTPCFVYSETKIREQVAALQTALHSRWTGKRKIFLAYAMKANSNKSILQLMHSLGCGMDIVSGGELLRARAAGIPADHIIFSGVGKTDDELRLALNENIHQINVESSAELARLDEITNDTKQTIKIALRYTPDVVSGAHAKTSTGEEENKFGLTEDEITDLFVKYQNHPYLKLRTLSMHIGSGVPTLTPFEEAFNHLASMIKDLRSRGCTVSDVDLGGGLWVPYEDGVPHAPLDDYAELITRIFASLDINISLEPGRLLIAESCALLTRVIYTKERENKKFVIVDAGMNDLIRPTLYEAHHPILPVHHEPNAPTAPCDVVGPVCETGDFFALDRILPTSLDRGDVIAIMVSGAYGTVMSSLYNTRPFAAEVMVKSDNARLIRKRQNLEDIWKDEI
jgi:diaminopimelate decarboxylase